MSSAELLNALECSFLKAADPALASRQSAYMRSQFSFLGLSKPVRAQLQKGVFSLYSVKTEQELLLIVQALWEKEQREFQYAALDLARRYQRLCSPQSLEIFEALIRYKSWWDTVDTIAAHLVGKLVLRHPRLFFELDQWIEDQDLWIRRSALLFQLSWKRQTQAQKLFDYCQKVMDENEFFIRKAIGWSLRQYSKTDPDSVRSFIERYRMSLSPLSIKEGGRCLPSLTNPVQNLCASTS